MLQSARFPMGSDPTGELSRLFGVYIEEEGVDLRGTFIISPDGTLLNSEVNFLNLGRNVEETLRKVEANLYLSKHGAEACPAQWGKPGDITLKPSEKLVGRVGQAMNKKK